MLSALCAAAWLPNSSGQASTLGLIGHRRRPVERRTPSRCLACGWRCWQCDLGGTRPEAAGWREMPCLENLCGYADSASG
jgi:hypothetical protein